MATVVIEPRFHGPPESGQGGYTCGLLAREIAGAAEVSLRLPPPLERELTLDRGEGEGVLLLRDGGAVVAEGRPVTLELEVPPPVGLAEAQAAVARFEGFSRHAFPTCFACGPGRDEGDGLRLFPGQVEGRDVIACPWTPDPALAGEDGAVRPEFVWAALDCPTAFACDMSSPIVLARLTGRIDRPIRSGEPHVITAWHVGRDGRKHHGACAIATVDGEVLAMSQALWIQPKDPGAFNVAQAS
jgi:hypothetical protein